MANAGDFASQLKAMLKSETQIEKAKRAVKVLVKLLKKKGVNVAALLKSGAPAGKKKKLVKKSDGSFDVEDVAEDIDATDEAVDTVRDDDDINDVDALDLDSD